MITIDENYGIETDQFGNYSLFRRRPVKTGKRAGEYDKDYIGHYSNLKGAVGRYVSHRFNEETENLDVSLSDAVKRLEAIEKDALSRLRF